MKRTFYTFLPHLLQDEILCTAWIAAEYLRTANFKDKVYVMGKEESIGEELEAAGIKYTGPGVGNLLLFVPLTLTAYYSTN